MASFSLKPPSIVPFVDAGPQLPTDTFNIPKAPGAIVPVKFA